MSTSCLEPVPISAAPVLLGEMNADLTIYLKMADRAVPVLYRKAGTGQSAPDFERLRENGVVSLLVKGEDLGRCEQMLEEGLSNVLGDGDVPPEQKADLVRHVGTNIARDLEASPDSPGTVDRASGLLDQVISSVLVDASIASGLLQVAAHHRTTASHLFAVSALAVLLGTEVFGSDPEELQTLGMAGMLHDLGKLAIPRDVLSKTAQLSPPEVQLIQQHPVESVRLLSGNAAISDPVRQMVLQHHERADGRGYPLGLPGRELLVGSKILSIVDSFHAMIGRRSYRNPMKPADAVERMAPQVGRQFDPTVFAAWKALFSRCWQPTMQKVETVVEDGAQKDNDRVTHRFSLQKATMSARSTRYACESRTVVNCFYAGRLQGVSSAPDQFSGTIKNLSRSGVCVASPHPVYRGEIVHLHMPVDGVAFWFKCMVAWCRWNPVEGQYLAGMQFLKRLPAAKAFEKTAPRGIDPRARFGYAAAAVV